MCCTITLCNIALCKEYCTLYYCTLYMHFVHVTFTPCQVSLQNIRDALPRRVEFLMKYARMPNDMLQRCTPFAVPPDSPFLETCIKNVRAYLDGPPSGDYDAIMNILEDSITKWGLEGAYNDANKYSIVPYWKWDAPVKRHAAAWHASTLLYLCVRSSCVSRRVLCIAGGRQSNCLVSNVL
jgi:hypothetical protein